MKQCFEIISVVLLCVAFEIKEIVCTSGRYQRSTDGRSDCSVPDWPHVCTPQWTEAPQGPASVTIGRWLSARPGVKYITYGYKPSTDPSTLGEIVDKNFETLTHHVPLQVHWKTLSRTIWSTSTL